MVYGGAPFSHLRDIAIKIAAISSPSTRISFPEYAVPIGKRGEDLSEHKFHVGPDLLTTLKSCLRFDPKQRASIPELLEQPFLRRTSGSCESSSKTRKGRGAKTDLDLPALQPLAPTCRTSVTASWTPSCAASPTRCAVREARSPKSISWTSLR